MTEQQTGTRAKIQTSAGEMTVEFRADKAPGHVENFLNAGG